MIGGADANGDKAAGAVDTDRLVAGLMENALDFLLSAAEQARSESLRQWKYSVLHLAASVELMVKTRLAKEYWALLFADVDKADKSKLESGDFRSVDFGTACDRLERTVGVTIPFDDVRQLAQLRALRNCLEHFVIELDENQARSLVARGTSVFLDFARAYLAEDLARNDDVVEAIHEHLKEFEEFIATHMEAISKETTGADALFHCSRCAQETMIIGAGDPRCAFCGFSCSSRELADSLGEGLVDEPCLNCGSRTLGFVLYHNEFGVDHCTTCGTKQVVCLRCRQRYVGDADECPHCGYAP